MSMPLALCFTRPSRGWCRCRQFRGWPTTRWCRSLSWRVQNLVLPLAVGVVATVGIMQIGRSELWVWYPWTYSFMAVNGGAVARQNEALMLASLVGTALFALSAYLLGRREVES